FDWPDGAARAVAGMVRAGWSRSRLRSPAPDAGRPAALGPLPLGLVPPEQAWDVLAEFGIPTVPQRLCGSPEEAAREAAALGYPVVAKAVGPVHKTDVG